MKTNINKNAKSHKHPLDKNNYSTNNTNIRAFGETVFYHKPTKTLLVTDTVLEVTNDVPKIFDEDPKPLLYHARDTVTEIVEDTPEIRERGWRRVVLFGLFFTPGALNIKDG